METMLLDVRYGLRRLRRSPAFTLVAVLTLALGIGANVFVFGVLNAVLLRPPSVSDPGSLYQMRRKEWMRGRLLTTSYPAFEDFRRRNRTFSGMAGVYAYSHARLAWRNAVKAIHGDEVTGNYFDLLGAQPEVGRFFHADDEHGPSSAPYLVLSHDLWQSLFGGDPAVVGATVALDRRPFTVVGVAPASFHGTERFVWPDYWMPMVNEAPAQGLDSIQSRKSVSVTVLGRLKPGVTPLQAAADLDAIAADLAKEYPETDERLSVRLIHPGLFGDEGEVIRGFLYGVSALALLVLAAACANLASLFAARASDASADLALRAALGSSRWRLVQPLLAETMMISVMGGAAGLVGADLLLGLLSRWGPLQEARLAASVDARAYVAGLALILGSALLSGMIPARQVLRSLSLPMMKRGPANPRYLGRFALRDLLLGAQVAICTLLVTASLVAVRGLVRALHVPLGFEPQGAILADVDLSQAAPGEVTIEKRKAMIEAARSLPGVTAAGSVSRTPMTGGLHGVPIYRPGTTDLKLGNSALAPYVFPTSPGYLEAAGTRLLSGRDVSWHDTQDTPRVAIVNETFARALWPGVPGIGERFILWGRVIEVVGVVEDGKYHDLQEPAQPVAYVPLSQREDAEMVLVVRSPLAPQQTAAALVRALGGIAPDASVTVRSWSETLEREFVPARAATVALGVTGVLAMMLAATGIFGMAAYSVSQRMKELGIRVALGARRAHVMTVAVGRPMVLLGIGSAAGLLAGVMATRLLRQIVYQADPGDPSVVGGVAVTMVLLGIAAAAIPARRALAVDPSELMRC